MVGLGCPSVDLHRVLQSQNQEFDPFIFHWGNKNLNKSLKNSMITTGQESSVGSSLLTNLILQKMEGESYYFN